MFKLTLILIFMTVALIAHNRDQICKKSFNDLIMIVDTRKNIDTEKAHAYVSYVL